MSHTLFHGQKSWAKVKIMYFLETIAAIGLKGDELHKLTIASVQTLT